MPTQSPGLWMQRQLKYNASLAQGTQADYGKAVRGTNIMYWGIRKQRCAPEPIGSRDESFAKILDFLGEWGGRLDADGKPISNLLGAAKYVGGQTYRVPINEGSEKRIAWINEYNYMQKHPNAWSTTDKDLQLAFHGTRWESLYSILYHRRLFESRNDTLGQNTKKYAEGIYSFSKKRFFAKEWKVTFYCRYRNLFSDGYFWAVIVEIMVDRNDSQRIKKGCDQWCNRSRAHVPIAVWFIGRTKYEMQDSCHIVVPGSW